MGFADEHLSYLPRDRTQELGVFTGGSLIVDSADRAETLARAQDRSLRRPAEVNRRGPAVLDAGQVKALLADGGHMVDLRPAADYAAAHGRRLERGLAGGTR